MLAILLEKVHSKERHKLGRQPGDGMPEIDVNAMIWGIFMMRELDGIDGEPVSSIGKIPRPLNSGVAS